MEIGVRWQDEQGNIYEVFQVDDNGVVHSMLITLSE